MYPAGISRLNNAVIISPPFNITERETQLLLSKLERRAGGDGRVHGEMDRRQRGLRRTPTV